MDHDQLGVGAMRAVFDVAMDAVGNGMQTQNNEHQELAVVHNNHHPGYSLRGTAATGASSTASSEAHMLDNRDHHRRRQLQADSSPNLYQVGAVVILLMWIFLCFYA